MARKPHPGPEPPSFEQNLDRLEGIVKRLEEIALKTDGVKHTVAISGQSILLGAHQGSMVKTYNSNGLVRNFVKANKWAIGYVGMAYVDTTVKALVLDGTLPTRANALAGKYRYVRKLFLVTKGKAKGLSLIFINYVLSKAGQAIISLDYLPIK